MTEIILGEHFAVDGRAPLESEWSKIITSASSRELAFFDQHSWTRLGDLLDQKKFAHASPEPSLLNEEIKKWAGFRHALNRR